MSVDSSALRAEPVRHLGEAVAKDPESGDGPVEVAGGDLVKRVGVGVVPLEITAAFRVQRETRYAGAHQRRDVDGSTSAGGDLAGLDSVE